MSTDTVARFREDDKRTLRDDVRRVLSTPEGRRVLMAIIGLGGVYAPTGLRGGSAVDLAYDTGRRDAAAELLSACNGTARELVQLAAEERTKLQLQRERSICDTRKEEKP